MALEELEFTWNCQIGYPIADCLCLDTLQGMDGAEGVGNSLGIDGLSPYSYLYLYT